MGEIEVVSVAAELRFVLWEVSGSNRNRNTTYTTVFSGLPQCLQVKAPLVHHCVGESECIRNDFVFQYCCGDCTAHCDAETCGLSGPFQNNNNNNNNNNVY